MKDDGPQLSVPTVNGSNVPGTSFDGMMRMPNAAETLDTTDPTAQDTRNTYRDVESFSTTNPPRTLKLLATRVGIGALIFLVLASVIFIGIQRANRSTPTQAGSFKSTHLPLANVVGTAPISVGGAPRLDINGQLVVSKTLTISPSAQPDTPTMGQIYYDNSANVLSFYNGTTFIPMGGSVIQNTTNVTNITNASGGGAVSSLTANGTQGSLAKFTGSQSLGASIFSDDGQNGSVTGNLNLITVATQAPSELRLWPSDPTPVIPAEQGDTNAVEVGVKFQVDVSGFITGMRFYKGTTNTGTHIGHIWSSTGTSLGTATFANESASGWQSVTFSSPIAVSAETTYVASYFAPNGNYAHDNNYFASGSVDNGSLHALQDGTDGANGVFKYTATPGFPNGGFNSLNYWVDVMFKPNPPPARYQVNGVQIGSSDLSNNSDLAKRTSSQLFSGVNTFRSSAASTSAFNIQSGSGVSLLSADTVSNRIVIGPAGDVTGIVFVLGRRIAVGDPAGAEGGMYFNSAQSMFRCFRNGNWGACADLEVESNFSQYDEFMGGQATSLSSGAIIGSLGWHPQAIGANGSIDFNPATPTPIADRPGVLALTTPAVANQGTTLMLGNGSNGSMIIQPGNVVKTAVAVGSNTNQVLRIGLHNESGSSTQPLSGAWWEANPAAHSNWRYCYGNGTTVVCTPTNFGITPNSWVRLEIRVQGAGASTIVFGINGDYLTVSSAAVDTTNRVSPAMSCYTTTGTAQSCYWDYFQLVSSTGGYR
jgi:hypothetical protein